MGDAETLFRWRNDSITRAASLNSEPVAWETHLAWLRASLDSPRRQLFVAEVEGEPVGTVRLDFGSETEISWTVSPKHRSRGIGTEMVKLACPSRPLIARIMRTNLASQRIAAAAGFRLADDGPIQRWVRDAMTI